LERRLFEHKEGQVEGFTQQYKAHKLVYFEIFDDPENAIMREKQIKNWSRKKKDFLIHQQNPKWDDLSVDWYKSSDPSASLGMTKERKQA
jgi:putative endonuclease